MLMGRTLCLRSRPSGELAVGDFEVTESKLPALADGDVLVRNLWLSIDPSVRIRLAESTPRGYSAPFGLGEPLVGLALGTVEESRSPDFHVGQIVSHMYGLRDFAVVRPGSSIGGYGELSAVESSDYPIEWNLGPLGSSGLTAYAGLSAILEIQPGDVVWVSAAAGAVGSIAAQLASLRGCTVIGSAGSDAKVAHLLDDFGLDAAFNYRNGPVADSLAAAAPTGIDKYFDSVGAEHLVAAIDAMRPGGRIAMCGAIADYDAAQSPSGPQNLFQLVSKGIRIEGFRAGSFNHLAPAMREEVGSHLEAGRMTFAETVFDGLEQAPQAMVDMLHGRHGGKTLCRLV
ncbi:NADP-dependent oxidoreductase [Gordonia zhenghanii]|uniref:NADP-dependent oxidoreductase n=2 Tax=Gordonia zhenghanii TaxID=2911516 RepID=UPI0027DED7FD|nr:NADP-dependent oxidoreductase [Gordonia zhenghanii]